VDVLGIGLDLVGLDSAMCTIRSAAAECRPLQVVTVNIDFIRIARCDPTFAEVLNESGLAVTDGKLLLWLTHFLWAGVPEQITGHDLVRECVLAAVERGHGVLLLGGGPGVAERAAAVLRQKHPTLRVAGMYGGRFDARGWAEDQAALTRAIREFAPRFLFVGLGCPKQDLWIARHLEEVGGPVAAGVGSVIDVIAGEIPRAPRWMQRGGLESLFQLLVAPRRYARRYLVDDPPMLGRIIAEITCKRFRMLLRSDASL